MPSLLGIGRALAASYPDRPIRFIVPFAPAGPTDIMARILGQNLGEALSGNVIVENRPGAGGNIGIGYTAHGEADGYTLLVISSAYVVNPSLYTKVPYDPFKDFAPITELGTTPNAIMISPNSASIPSPNCSRAPRPSPTSSTTPAQAPAPRRIFPANF